MTPQSKILKTKKRLSRNQWHPRTIVLGFIGLSIILGTSLRAVSTSARYGLVTADIPVIRVPVPDPAAAAIKPSQTVDAATPVLLLTEEEFLLGDVESFTTRITDIRNKFSIKHQDGAPRIDALFRTINKWVEIRKSKPATTIIFVPVDNIPAPVVVQVVSQLKKTAYFKKVVLAGGLL